MNYIGVALSINSMDLPVGDLRLLTAKEHPPHLLVLECAQIIHTHTMSCVCQVAYTSLYGAHAWYYVMT